ncbi:MAG: HD domain-containing protein [Candidatus Omnitrophica bacterium]|nr:HD domain-containing protein [Candidatus Omnitrophica bacterium COP1]MCK6496699.1 HD domain-containing protein [bacterium]MCL4735168.1 HD domain-containing protein [Candidatus Omnitrophota bacterium]NUP91615.1 HD domain-containing protein [Candidatus Omnitrophota bacterium]
MMPGEDLSGLSFFPIQLQSLRVETVLPFPIFLRHASSGQYILYRSKNTSFTQDILQQLIDNRIEEIYVPRSERDEFFEYASREIRHVVRDPDMDSRQKAEVVYSTTTRIMEDLFATPRASRRLRQAKMAIHYSVEFILYDENATRNLLKLTSHDYYTYTHSVNVTIYALALARRVYSGELDRHNFKLLAEGFLLHDLGKSVIPASIINHPGKLNETQWNLMRQHPEIGRKILEETHQNNEVLDAIVYQHHERIDGKGYPRQISRTEIHPYARLCALADVFDAITTVRSYREPLTTFEALKTMKDTMGDHFDWDYFNEFVKLFREDSDSADPADPVS